MRHPKRDTVQGRNIEAVQDSSLEGLDIFHQRTRSSLGQGDSNCCKYNLMNFRNAPKSGFLHFQFAAIVLGSFFFGNTLSMKHENVLNINTVLFMCLIALTFINMVSVANIFCAEIPIFVREQQNNMYRIDLYFITKQLAELPFFLITPLVFNFIFYWMVGLNPDFERFAVSTGLTILVTEVSFSSEKL